MERSWYMKISVQFSSVFKNFCISILFDHNFEKNWARKSRLVRFCVKFKTWPNLTNHDLRAQFVLKLYGYKHDVRFFFCIVTCNYLHKIHSYPHKETLIDQLTKFVVIVPSYILRAAEMEAKNISLNISGLLRISRCSMDGGRRGQYATDKFMQKIYNKL